MNMHEILGSIIVCGGMIFYVFGLYGIIKNNHFYVRLSVSSLIDSAGFITIMIGLIVYKGFNSGSLKIGFILLLMLLLNPLSNHILGRGAYLSHYEPEKEVTK